MSEISRTGRSQRTVSTALKSRLAVPSSSTSTRYTPRAPGSFGCLPCELPGIDHGRRLFAKHLTGMHVPKRPVIDAGSFEVILRTWGVGVVPRPVPDVSVHQADGERVGSTLPSLGTRLS